MRKIHRIRRAAILGLGGLGHGASAGSGSPGRRTTRRNRHPGAQAQVAWSLRRNSDPTLPASHVLELSFAMPAEVGGGGVQNVPGVMVKDSEEARGRSSRGCP